MIRRWYHYVEGVKVYWHGEPIQIGDTRIAHPTEEQLLEAGYEYEDIDPHPEPTLDQLKQMKCDEIAQYDMSDAVNGFILGGKDMWISYNLRDNYMSTVQGAKRLGYETVLFLGQTIPVDTAITMIDMVNLYAMQCTNVTDAHKAAVMELETKEEVENYDYTIGYPPKINFDEMIANGTLPEEEELEQIEEQNS